MSFNHLTLAEMDPQTIHPLTINKDNFLVIMSEVYYTRGHHERIVMYGGVAFQKGPFRTSTVFTIFCFSVHFRNKSSYSSSAIKAFSY